MKYKVGDRVKIKSLDWFKENRNNLNEVRCGATVFVPKMTIHCGHIRTISKVCETQKVYYLLEDVDLYTWTDEMIEGLVEEETPKFKVKDIVFVKNIGWVRITNSYWDSLANEYIYEAIGFDGKGEYDYISQSNIECQMLPESENPHTGGNKITLDEYKNNDKEWLFNKLAMLDNITALESIQDIFNHLQQHKYPKTYEECCKILDITPIRRIGDIGYKRTLLNVFEKLLVCRDAYWKIAGEEMGLGKPWENSRYEVVYGICRDEGNIVKLDDYWGDTHIFEFPIREMRDAFKENFNPDIEICKEFL